MKNTLKKSFGIIAFVAVIGLLMTSASVWNNDTPKADRVSLYYPDDFEIEAINGETKSAGPIMRTYPGKGSYQKSKLALLIPPGQTTIKMVFASGLSPIYSEVSFDFLPGGHYRLIPTLKAGISLFDLVKGVYAGMGDDPWTWKVDKIK